MLEKLFLEICNRSITASYIILAVMVVRLLLLKGNAPRIFSYALWSVVLFRLLTNFSFNSVFSIFTLTGQSAEDIRPFPTQFTSLPETTTVIQGVNSTTVITALERPPFELIYPTIWLIGIAVMVTCSAISFVRLRRKLIGATPVEKNIYIADLIDSPFVMGLVNPKIYLPSCLAERELDFIIKHEETHIRRLDHITRILGFIALSVHWFNPLVWMAFILSGKDMESACDESVMGKIDKDVRADYAETLLKFAVGRKMITATPLAFGEGDVKGRITNILSYKKPVVWISGCCLVLVGVVAISFMSNGEERFNKPPTIYAYYEYGVVPMNLGGYSWTEKGLFSAVHVEACSVHCTEMDYPNVISYGENKGHRNANIIFSLDNSPEGWNSDNMQWSDEIELVELKRYKDGKEEILDDFDKNLILVSLEDQSSYIYEFKFRFNGDSSAYYSVQIDNNMDVAEDVFGTTSTENAMAEEDKQQTTLPLTEQTATDFIHQTLSTFTLDGDNRVSFVLPETIPTSIDENIDLMISLNVTFSPEPGTSSLQRLLDNQGGWVAGERYTEVLDVTKGEPTRLLLRVAFVTRESENSDTEYAADYLELIAPFNFPVNIGNSTVQISQTGNEGILHYTIAEGTAYTLSLTLPQGVTLESSDTYTLFPPAFADTIPAVIAVKDNIPIGRLSLTPIGTTDKEGLSQIDTAENSLPMEIYAPIALSNHVQITDYKVCKSSATAANSTAKYLWQNLTEYPDDAANAPWLESDSIVAYDYEVMPYFVHLHVEDGRLRPTELESIAKSMVLSH